MEPEKILTIGIPVFNEEKGIGKNLTNIINIIRTNNLSNCVNILVSNNCSTDNTLSILENFIENNNDIFNFLNNETNIGFDNNVNQVVVSSNTEYVWLLSGNDTITEQGLLDILRVISEKKPCIVVLDRGYLNKEYEYYEDWYKFINNITGLNICVSCNVINKNLWINNNIFKYSGSNWIFMGYIIECFNNNIEGGIVIYKHIIIGDIADEGIKWDDKKGFWLRVGLLLTDLFYYNLHNIYLKKKCCKMMIGSVFRYSKLIILARRQTLIISKEIKNQIRRAMFYNKYSFYLFIIPSIYLPLSFFSFFEILKKILFYNENFCKLINYFKCHYRYYIKILLH